MKNLDLPKSSPLRGKTALVALAAVAGLCLLIMSCETQASLTRKRTHDTERGLLRAGYLKGQKPEKLALDARMQFYKVPGVAIAVMDKNGLEWTAAYGFRGVHSHEPVTTATIFQAGAIGQPVAAAAALKLAAQGRLDIDADVNTILKSRKVPRNEFTAKAPVTVRRILTHTAGFPPGPLPGFARNGRIPSLMDMLEGRAGAGLPAIEPDAVPGGDVRPSEAGYAVLGKILEDASAEPFAALMKQTVFGPLGLANSAFEVPLSTDKAFGAASGHGRDGRPVDGQWLEYPADGFWTSASEMVAFAADLMASATGKGGKLLTPELARQMLTPQAGNWSFGFAIEGAGQDVRTSLRGRTQGFTAAIDIYPYRGQGEVILTNSDNGTLLTDEILRALSAVYEWPDFKPEERTVYRLDPSQYPQFAGRYQVTPEYFLDVSVEGYYLVIRPTGQAPTKFYVENQTFFFSVDPTIRIQFLRDAKGVVTGLVLWQEDFKQEARKIG